MRILIQKFACVALVLAAFCSCNKSGTDLMRGSYSFKTGGYVKVSADDTTFIRNIFPESGQMRIVSESVDAAIVTMNVQGGAPLVFDAVVSGKSISLGRITRPVVLSSPETEIEELVNTTMLEVSGTGKYVDGTIIFEMIYSGEYDTGVFKGTVSESHVNCVATRNE